MICKPSTLLNFQYFNYNYGKLYYSKIFPELIKNFPELNKIFPELKFYKLQKVQDQRPGIKIQYLQKLQILYVGIVYLNIQISIKTLQSYNSLTVIQDAYLKNFQLPKPISAAIILTNLPIPTNLRYHIASPKSSRIAIASLFSVSAHSLQVS